MKTDYRKIWLKTSFIFLIASMLVSCSRPQYYCRTVKREATCKFMATHPIKDTINNDLRHSYVVKYHAGLYPDEMIKCNCKN